MSPVSFLTVTPVILNVHCQCLKHKYCICLFLNDILKSESERLLFRMVSSLFPHLLFFLFCIFYLCLCTSFIYHHFCAYLQGALSISCRIDEVVNLLVIIIVKVQRISEASTCRLVFCPFSSVLLLRYSH